MKTRILVALCAAMLSLAGCVSQTLEPSDIRMLPYTSGGWPSHDKILGLKDAITQAKPDRPVKLLLVHGMIAKPSAFSDRIQKRIIEAGLRLKRDKEQPFVDLERGYDLSLWLYPQPGGHEKGMRSRLTRSVWRDPNGTPKLIAYELVW